MYKEENNILELDKNKYLVEIQEKVLSKHKFKCGLTGSSKTNDMLNFLNKINEKEVLIE